MEKELIIASSPTEVQIALLEDRKLVELHKQKTNSNFSVGDIWLGKVTKLDPVLNAAFVDIGFKKDAFLHYTDLTPKVRSLIKYTNGAVSGGQSSHLLDTFRFEPDIVKTGKIDQVLQKKQLLMVQVLKEPISTKGPRLSCEVTIPGRYLVLAPFSTGISVSKKIANEEERTRLNLLIKSICPKNFGVIVRTAAEGKKVADLYEELTSLMEKWQQIHKQMHNAQQPVKLLSELDRTSSILRDLLSDSFSRVIVDDAALYQSTKDYLAQIAPQKVDIVKNYSGTKPVFEHYGVTRQIKSTFGKTTSMPS